MGLSQSSAPSVPGASATSVVAKKTSAKAPKVLAGLAGAIVVTGSIMFVLGHGRETTDDAQVDGHIANIGSRVAGRVDKVLVQDNQEVKPGDVLIEQDKDELTARLAAAAA